MIEEAIYNLLKDDAGVGAIAEDRIYPSHLPQRPTFPAIAYTRISTYRELHHNGAFGAAEATFQITCFADDPKEAKELAAAVRALFHAYSGTKSGETIFVSQIVNETDLFDVDLVNYQVAVDLVIRHKET